MIDVERYLKMSKYNPEFQEDYSYVVRELADSKDKGEIDQDTYIDLVEKMKLVKLGKTAEPIWIVFNKYLDIRREGYFRLDFTENELDLMLQARSTTAKFFNWADLSKHRKDNQYVHQYLNRLSQEALSKFEEDVEEKWDILHQLKRALISTVSRGVVSRTKVTPFAKVLGFLMTKEYEVRSKIEEKNLKFMNLFKTSEKSEKYDIGKVTTHLAYLYLTSLPQHEKLYRDSADEIIRMYNEGKLRGDDYEMYVTKLSEYGPGISNITKVGVYTPIVDFQWCLQYAPDTDIMLLYNEEQITNALQFCRDFHKAFTNEALEREMILVDIDRDLSEFGDQEEAKSFTRSSLTRKIELLKQYDVIPVTRYLEYMEKVRERFK